MVQLEHHSKAGGGRKSRGISLWTGLPGSHGEFSAEIQKAHFHREEACEGGVAIL